MNKKPQGEEYPLYGGDITLKYQPGKHIYSIGDGDKEKGVYGVTGVTGILPKDWMAGYVRKHAKLYLNDTPISLVGDITKHINNALMASYYHGKRAAQIGTNVHQAVQNWLENDARELLESKEEENSLLAFGLFIKDNKLGTIFSERKCLYMSVSKGKLKDPVYAGTVDWIGLLNGKRTIIDWKTSKGIYSSHIMQANAYACAINREIEFSPKLKKKIGGEIEQIAIVRLGKNGKLETIIQKVGDIKVFLHLLSVKHWLQINK